MFFITSDYHLGHSQIIHYCQRPFRDIDHMNAEIIRRHNERVKPADTVIHNGDFCFGKNTWEDKLNGNIIHIRGNHDRNNNIKTRIESLVLEISHEKIWVCHKPCDIDYTYRYAFVGHVHEKWSFITKGDTIAINVGVDQNNFYPLTLIEALEKAKNVRSQI